MTYREVYSGTYVLSKDEQEQRQLTGKQQLMPNDSFDYGGHLRKHYRYRVRWRGFLDSVSVLQDQSDSACENRVFPRLPGQPTSTPAYAGKLPVELCQSAVKDFLRSGIQEDFGGKGLGVI